MHRFPVRPAAWLAAFVLLASRPAAAQKLGWTGQAEVSGNLFFGNTRQLLAATRLSAEHVDSSARERGELRFNYGQNKTTDDVTIISKRSWLATTSADWRPYAAVSPYAQAQFESSLEKQLERRYSAGAGVRYNLVHTPTTEVVLSTGALAERTKVREDAPVDPGKETSLARGQGILRLKRAFSERVSLTSETTYQPALKEFGDYTLVTDNSVRAQLSKRLSLTVSLRNSFDSEAKARGARTNNDGEVLLGLLAAF